MKQRITLITFAIVGILLLGLQSLLIQPKQEAWALQAVNITTNGNIAQIRYVTVGGTPAFVALEGTPPTQVQVINANTSAIISSFNMTNALMNGFNIVYSALTMDCNSSLQICAVGYDTGGSGTCTLSPNLCRDRVVLIDYKNNAWSALKNGYNYTYTSNVLGSVALSFGQTQFNVFATYQPNGGGNGLIDTLVFNSTDAVNSHPLVFGNTFNTGSNALYNVASLGTFTFAGVCCNNFEAEGSQGTTAFIDFYRNTNSAGCSVALGSSVRDITYVSDSVGTFWYIVYGTTIAQLSQTATSTCTITNSVNLSTLTGGNNLNSIAVDSTRHEIYTQSNGKVYVMNQTSFSATPILTFNSPTTNIPNYHGGLASFPNGNNGALGVPWGSANSKLLIEYWNVQGGTSNPPATGSQTICIDFSPPGGSSAQLTCFTCPGTIGTPQAVSTQCPFGYPNPEASGTNPRQFQGFYNGTQSIGIWGCSLGWFSCKNENVVTNGAGYFALIVVIMISAVLLLYATYRTGHEATDIVMILALVAILECGAFWKMNITDSIPFFVGILGIIGLGAFKMYNRVAQ